MVSVEGDPLVVLHFPVLFEHLLGHDQLDLILGRFGLTSELRASQIVMLIRFLDHGMKSFLEAL